ncbi:hypothetical protein C5E22_00230 [Pectobacterium parmentieri]|uniref:Uncharacterized protein n=1 Tax=Pectobacterium parmentieri TaxID=1905730 RepID=A0A8B3G852_PECPM|nr:hypothetical protein A8F97_18135 [Pectobacterium parmentieri]AYH03948.1 hypothetical protein C5E25_00230 [Pectobacterium parmentieri]AYH08277.1 hypothetical protein C5E24_00230 [Pectobacterium parmentieri]AYH12770.1 hypothetical protein C5E23_00230 [Pectobacterium parmentieri]AYH17020.1 hypothetical protein C5E22_00230 [Pectobacterium parmentieri]
MMLTSKCKAFIRWGSIFLVSFFYLISIAIFSFGHVHDKERMVFLSDKTVSVEYHFAILADMQESMNSMYLATLIGFPISVILIMIIFKKVR